MTGSKRPMVERAEHARKVLEVCSADRVGAMLKFSEEEAMQERLVVADALETALPWLSAPIDDRDQSASGVAHRLVVAALERLKP